jgi:hypothetical protein
MTAEVISTPSFSRRQKLEQSVSLWQSAAKPCSVAFPPFSLLPDLQRGIVLSPWPCRLKLGSHLQQHIFTSVIGHELYANWQSFPTPVEG